MAENRDLSRGSGMQGDEAAFEACVARGSELLSQNPSRRPLLRKALQLMTDGPVDLRVIERTLADDPRCAKGKLAPYFYAQWLADAGIAVRYDTDANGDVVHRADYPDLDDDAFDDMLEGFAYQVTDAGREVLRRFSASVRLRELFEHEPQRQAVYEDVLAFLTERHHLGQIEAYVRALPSYAVLDQQGGGAPSPSVFVDKLSDAGAIVFDGGWIACEGRGEPADL